MDVRKRKVGPVTVATLQGELDGRSGPATRERLVGMLSPRAGLVVDLTGVPYMSSAGLRTMLLLYREAQCVDARVALVGVSPELRSLMSATGFLGFFVVENSVSACVDALQDRSEETSNDSVAGA